MSLFIRIHIADLITNSMNWPVDRWLVVIVKILCFLELTVIIMNMRWLKKVVLRDQLQLHNRP
jgi:uncharacterized protein (DUF983 family)